MNYSPRRQRRPRRERYIATVSHERRETIERVETLSYSVESAERTYHSHGFTILDGPHLKRDLIRQRAAARAWRIDHEAIRRCFRDLTGRDVPACLTIKLETVLSRQGGFIVSPDGRITLTVSAAETPSRAAQILWHELCHLNQYLDRIERESAHPGTVEAFHVQHAHCKSERASRVGYTNRPSEREARSWETLADTDPLVK